MSHNDVNPGNLLWDGASVWLIDWEVVGLGHPYYDLATLALFLRLEEDVALQLVARHDGAAPDESSVASFRALRQLAGVLCGLTFLSLVDDLNVRQAPTRQDAPTLGECSPDCVRASSTCKLRVGKPRSASRCSLGSLGLSGNAQIATGCSIAPRADMAKRGPCPGYR